MNKALLNIRVRKLHLWFGIVIGAQLGLWLISGLFMTLFPIEQVRGDHLKASSELVSISSQTDLLPLKTILSGYDDTVNGMRLKVVDGQASWIIRTNNEKDLLVDARTGEALSPLSEDIARRIANGIYIGKGEMVSAELVDTPPREYGRPGPVWRVDYSKPQGATLYVDATTGDVKAVRTGLWRTFDFMWGLHIMDWSNRENFNSWWIKMTASLAVLFFISGLILVFLKTGLMFRRRQRSGPKAEQRAGISNLDKAKK